MDQFHAFNPDYTTGFGDYYDPRDDPRQPSTIAKYGGRVSYCAEPTHRPSYHYGTPPPQVGPDGPYQGAGGAPFVAEGSRPGDPSRWAPYADRPVGHPPRCGCPVCLGFSQRTWDTTGDYDYIYQGGTNFRPSTRCAESHRGTHDTRVPLLRPAWGTEQMTGGGSAQGDPTAPVDPGAAFTQLFFLFVLFIVVSTMIGVATMIQLRSLKHELFEARKAALF